MALNSYQPMQPTDTKTSWPLAKFYFSVNFGSGVELGFQAVEGLSITVEPYEFRDGNSSNFHKEKRPGLVSYDPVTLKKGVFVSDSALYAWQDKVRGGSWDMRTVTIKLKDEAGADVFTWTLKGAFPTKFTATSMDANDADEVAIEELELTCQSWEMQSSGGGAMGGLLSFVQGAASSAFGSLIGSAAASASASFGL